MKMALLSTILLALPASVVAQSICPHATSDLIEHKPGFTIHAVRWSSAHGLVKAMAATPDSTKPTHATVFSFSTLVGSEPQQSVDVMPLAIELTKQGWSTMVMERKLTWPEVDPSVGSMRADVMCAEQWLSKHATITSSDWIFVGPDSDAPDPALWEKPGMTGWVGFIVGDEVDRVSTEHLLHSTLELRSFILSQRFMGE